MGRKWGWISTVKKAFSFEPKEKKEKKTNKSKDKSHEKETSDDQDSSLPIENTPLTREKSDGPSSSFAELSSLEQEKFYDSSPSLAEPEAPNPITSSKKEVKSTKTENDRDRHAYSLALATTVAAVAAAQAAAEVVRLTAIVNRAIKPNKKAAAIKIQAAFRGYLARKALRASRGWARLKSLIQGQSVKRQTTTTLLCMQTLARVQSQIYARRMRMSEDNQALQRQLSQQKQDKDHKRLKSYMEPDWNSSRQSKEELKAKLHSKQEAAMRREKALAYAKSHKLQKGKSSPSESTSATMMDLNTPHWGWSWLERWMETRPWEKGACDGDSASVKCATNYATSVSVLRRSTSVGDLKLDNKILSVVSKTRPSSPKRHGASDPKRSLSSLSQNYTRNGSPRSSSTTKTRPPSPLRNKTLDKDTVNLVAKRLSLQFSPIETRKHALRQT